VPQARPEVLSDAMTSAIHRAPGPSTSAQTSARWHRPLVGRVPSVAVLAPLDVADPVGPHGRVMEQGRALRGRVPLRKPFEGVRVVPE